LSPDEQSLFRGARDAYTQIRLLNLCESLGALLQDKNMGKKIREEIKARQDSLLNK
jgi:hypothetical protein